MTLRQKITLLLAAVALTGVLLVLLLVFKKEQRTFKGTLVYKEQQLSQPFVDSMERWGKMVCRKG